MVFLEVEVCEEYSAMAVDPCLHPSCCSAALLCLGCMVQPPPALAIIDTHVTGQLPVKTRTLVFFLFFSLVFHELFQPSHCTATYMSTSGSTGLGAGLCSQKRRTRLVQTCWSSHYTVDFGASLALLSPQSRVLPLSSGLERHVGPEGNMERVGLFSWVTCKHWWRKTKTYWASVVMVSDRSTYQRGQQKFHTLLGNAVHNY